MAPATVNIGAVDIHTGEEDDLITGQKEHRVLPLPDKGKLTERLSLAGLALVWICGIVCIAGAASFYARPCYSTVLSVNGQLPAGFIDAGGYGSLYAFIVTTILTICTEATGFVHDVCLRWNLFHERRLRWTTNLRLLSTSRVTPATRGPSNLLYFLTLAISYTASSQIFLWAIFAPNNNEVWGGTGNLANAAAVMALGVCLILQGALITWIYFASRQHIKTWSSNALTVTLACVYFDDHLASASTNPGYSALVPTAARLSRTNWQSSEHELGSPPLVAPSAKQPSLFATRKKAIRLNLCFISVLPALLAMWAAIVLVGWHRSDTPISLSELGSDDSKALKIISDESWINAPAIQPFPYLNGDGTGIPMSTTVTTFICLLIVFCIQAYLTFALHCIEVIVNSARDQKSWEQAAKHLKSAKANGAPLDPNIVVSFLSSPPNLCLLASKSVAHWLFNRAVLPLIFLEADLSSTNQADNTWENTMTEIKLFGVPVGFLAGLILVLLALTWYLACRCPVGPQPSKYGHIRTLAELIDDWGNGQQLYWGDKGVASDSMSRCVGTSSNASDVGNLRFDAQYL